MTVPSSGTLARVRRAVFARHSSPWSAWTRWATRAMLGEEQWIVDRPKDAALDVNAAASVAGVAAVVAASRRRPAAAAVATAAEMALLLVYWELMARYFDRRKREEPAR